MALRDLAFPLVKKERLECLFDGLLAQKRGDIIFPSAKIEFGPIEIILCLIPPVLYLFPHQ